ncbi:CBS domain-containing protein [Alteromonas sp. ASW11-19]|uniref:CBS domain-containing protein n=1 Tax=Alteromonas salexigens TaxID=2982530 RepID=A0ABT2VQY3_9ALTE|nr:CBS domain-containing protein [Alteromonas salexigens]MCU7555715.1 CBS domain-containing protein [Alteromonas salexigens]
MITIADIMSSPVTTLTTQDTLKTAHDLTRKLGIRHLPVIDRESGQLRGVVTQRTMVAKILSLLNLYGAGAINEREAATNVMEVAVVDFRQVNENEPVKSVASGFLHNKHGCLPVINEAGALTGIVTSSDFVKLSLSLLEQVDP